VIGADERGYLTKRRAPGWRSCASQCIFDCFGLCALMIFCVDFMSPIIMVFADPVTPLRKSKASIAIPMRYTVKENYGCFTANIASEVAGSPAGHILRGGFI
jgi:hypothetical protein